ncbi:DDE-type integrase/transposase/recombinase [Viridibacillus sp. YIM B01967]|uniref:DDE-type integrase/transposase/recombinase n=1 Tax=Viridibacillus soli TaxID=2798301 RepID=A0ABS1HA30_9BACL|nr:DDE-type integrase/transposase/recombinase [Viridibacillus soli]
MDLFSRKIIGWRLATYLKTDLTLVALRHSIISRQPEKGTIHHSDRGSQYCANDYIEELNAHKFRISISRKGNPYNNACIESYQKKR